MLKATILIIVLSAISSLALGNDSDIIGTPTPEWENIYIKEANRIKLKAYKLQNGHREFDIIDYKEFAYFSSQVKQDMLVHSSQYLGGGNKFGWVVLEQLDDRNNNIIVLEKYSFYSDGKLVKYGKYLFLELIDDDNYSAKGLETVLYKWQDNHLKEVLRYYSDQQVWQNPFQFMTCRVFDNDTNDIYVVKYSSNNIENKTKYLVDLYSWSGDQWQLKKKNMSFNKELKNRLNKLDVAFNKWLSQTNHL